MNLRVNSSNMVLTHGGHRGGWTFWEPSSNGSAQQRIDFRAHPMNKQFRQNNDGPGWTANRTITLNGDPDVYRPVPFKVIDAAYNQAGFRGRNDNGSEATATWKAAENANWSQEADENFRVRFVVDEIAGGWGITETLARLQYNLNGAGWNSVTAASSVVRIFTSPNEVDNADTTRQLASGSGDFAFGDFDESGGSASWPGGEPDGGLAFGDLTEIEFCVQIISADVVGGDSIQLRVRRAGVLTTPLEQYDNIPTITVSESVSLVIQDALHGHTADNVVLAVPVQYDQLGFRGRNDDGDEATATWKAAENTNWPQPADQNFRVRFAVKETVGGTVDFETALQLQCRRNAGAWQNVTISSTIVRTFASPNVLNNQELTRQLTSGSGTYQPGGFDENNGQAPVGAPTLTGDFDNFEVTEVEYAVQIRSVDVAGNDTIDLRLVENVGNAPLAAYTVTPSMFVPATLVTQDATHSHAADNPALTQLHLLVIQDALHAHLADNLGLTQVHVLAIADALHAHAADNLTITEDGAVNLVIQDALHSHAADGLVLTQAHILAIADALHAHLADNLVLTQVHNLTIQDTLHGHLADQVVLTVPGGGPALVGGYYSLRRHRGPVGRRR